MNKRLFFIISDTPLDTLEEMVTDAIAQPDGIKMLAKVILDATYCDIKDAMNNNGLTIHNSRIKAIPIPPEINRIWSEQEKISPIFPEI